MAPTLRSYVVVTKTLCCPAHLHQSPLRLTHACLVELPLVLAHHSVWSRCTSLEKAVLLMFLWWTLQITSCGAMRLGRPAQSTTPTMERRAACHVTGAQQVNHQHPKYSAIVRKKGVFNSTLEDNQG